MEKQQKSWTTMKVYLLISSLAGLFGILIGFGIVISQFVSFYVISQDEYINNRYWDVKQCEDTMIMDNKGVSTEKTPTEIKTCKEESTDRLIIGRKYELKDSAVNGALRGFLFLIIFIVHYPKFVRYNKE